MEFPAGEALTRGEGLSHDRALISEPLVHHPGHGPATRPWGPTPDREDRIRGLDDHQLTRPACRRARAPGRPGVRGCGLVRSGWGDGYADVVDRIEQLPGGVQPVEESSVAVHRRILQDLRQEGTPDR